MLTNLLADFMRFSWSKMPPTVPIKCSFIFGWRYFKVCGLAGKVQTVNLYALSYIMNNNLTQ